MTRCHRFVACARGSIGSSSTFARTTCVEDASTETSARKPARKASRFALVSPPCSRRTRHRLPTAWKQQSTRASWRPARTYGSSQASSSARSRAPSLLRRRSVVPFRWNASNESSFSICFPRGMPRQNGAAGLLAEAISLRGEYVSAWTHSIRPYMLEEAMNAQSTDAVSHLATPTTRRPGALYWLALGTFAIGTEGFMIAALLTIIAADIRVSVAEAGLLVSIFALAYATSSPLLTALTGRVERRQLLLGSMSLFAVFNMAAAQAHSFLALAAARVLLAFAAGIYTPNANALAGALVPAEQRGRAIAIVNGGLTAAIALGVPLGALAAVRPP